MIDAALRRPAAFQAALLAVPPEDRERWLDDLLGLEEWPADGPDLPRGCTPYLPCSARLLLEAIDAAEIDASDVLVDVGSGLGRALALVHLFTGAEAIGIEVQSGLAGRAVELAAQWQLPRVQTIQGDAALLAGGMAAGTVFFFYSPFGSDRMEAVTDALRPLAATRPLRLCFVDVPPPERPWLVPQRRRAGSSSGLTLVRSTGG